MIRNVIFDIGNVLVEFGWQKYVKELPVPEEDKERLINATVKSPVWNETDRGLLTEEEILTAFINNDPGIESSIRVFYENFEKLLTQFKYSKGWIIDLKNQGYKVYCLSNMSHKAVKECGKALDIIDLTDGYVLSCDINYTKPEPEIYETLLERFSLVPSECVFFDDVEANITAAEKFGMHGIVFKDLKTAVTEFEKIVKAEMTPGDGVSVSEKMSPDDGAGKSKYSKKQRIGAIVCLSVIALLYLVTLILTFIGADWARNALKVALGCTLVLPILTWIYIWLMGKLTHRETIADFNFFKKNDKQ